MTPFLIYAAVTILADLFVSQIGLARTIAADPVQFLLTAAEQVFAMAFAVGIHRYVLLGEGRPGFAFFRWDRHFVRYILLTMLLLLLVVRGRGDGAGGASASIPASQTIKMDATAALIGSAVLFTVSVIISRLSLLLPSAAIGDEVPARTDLAMATERNGFRLLATALLVALPFVIVDMALAGLRDMDGLAFPVTILLGLVTSVQLIVVTIMLSLSYDVLVRGGGPPAR